LNTPMRMKSEFAHVCVQLDQSANGVRLMIKDIRTGKTVYLDPLELESLAWCQHEDLVQLLNPTLTRWRRSVKAV